MTCAHWDGIGVFLFLCTVGDIRVKSSQHYVCLITTAPALCCVYVIVLAVRQTDSEPG